jgi:hypothetical protein
MGRKDDHKAAYLFCRSLGIVTPLVMSLGAWSPAATSDTKTLWSNTYDFVGQCTGGDMVYQWGISAYGVHGTLISNPPANPPGSGKAPAQGEYGKSFIYPWSETDVTIRGVEITLVPAGPTTPLPKYSLLMVGNLKNGDAMVWLSAGETHAINWYPAGTGFQFAGTKDQDPETYIDLHGGCSTGAEGNVMVTFYYTIN